LTISFAGAKFSKIAYNTAVETTTTALQQAETCYKQNIAVEEKELSKAKETEAEIEKSIEEYKTIDKKIVEQHHHKKEQLDQCQQLMANCHQEEISQTTVETGNNFIKEINKELPINGEEADLHLRINEKINTDSSVVQTKQAATEELGQEEFNNLDSLMGDDSLDDPPSHHP